MKQNAKPAPKDSEGKPPATPGKCAPREPKFRRPPASFSAEIDPELNASQERFAQLVALGFSLTEAYEQAGWKRDNRNAARLYNLVKVRRRVYQLRMETARACKMTRDELAAYLVDILSTPVGAIDESHHLAQEIDYSGKGGLSVKGPSKLGAAQLLANICGWNKGTEAEIAAAASLGGVAELMARIRAGK